MRTIAIVGLVMALLAQPARADGERTLLDMTIEVRPDGNASECMRLDAGTLTAVVQMTGDGAVVPVRFVLGGAGNGLRRTGEPVVTLVAMAPSTFAIPIQGGVYCYYLAYEGYRPPGIMTTDETRQYAQYVAVKLTWAPPAP